MRYPVLVLVAVMAFACKGVDRPERPAEVRESGRAPERFLPKGLASRRDSVLLRSATHRFDTDDAGQPDTLPTLPEHTTIEDIRNGDVLFHGKGGCVNCHDTEATGLAGRGSSLTVGLHLIESDDLRGIDSIIVNGIADAETRSPIAMPPRGQRTNLTTTETHALAAYVWALATTRGEPWPGGHAMHGPRDQNASARSAIP
jgi:mono/diheme cytochrome c family protein